MIFKGQIPKSTVIKTEKVVVRFLCHPSPHEEDKNFEEGNIDVLEHLVVLPIINNGVRNTHHHPPHIHVECVPQIHVGEERAGGRALNDHQVHEDKDKSCRLRPDKGVYGEDEGIRPVTLD